MRYLRYLGRDECGQMGITFVLSIVAIFMFFALALDAGIWAFDHRWAQTQAESAALAAVAELPAADTTEATAAADAWLGWNGAAPGDRSCIEYSDRTGDGVTDTVRVCVRRQSPRIFSFVSIPSVWISAAARATVWEQPAVYALMVMDETECDTLWLNGGPIVNITSGGGSYTRSSCEDGLRVSGNSEMHSGVNDTLTGDADVDGLAELDPPATQADWLPDPYEYLQQPVPTASGCPITSAESNIMAARTLDPGTYCHELRLTASANVTLNPGTYILLGGITMTAGAQLTGNNVLLYSTCASTRPAPCNGQVAPNMFFTGGTGSVSLEGSTDYQPECTANPACPSMVLWTDRTSGQSNPDNPYIRFRGSTAGGIDGRVYNYQGTVDIGGDPSVTMTLNMSVVADHIQFSGDATFNMPFNPLLAPTIRMMALIE